jgi:hypothetical protein
VFNTPSGRYMGGLTGSSNEETGGLIHKPCGNGG